MNADRRRVSDIVRKLDELRDSRSDKVPDRSIDVRLRTLEALALQMLEEVRRLRGVADNRKEESFVPFPSNSRRLSESTRVSKQREEERDSLIPPPDYNKRLLGETAVAPSKTKVVATASMDYGLGSLSRLLQGSEDDAVSTEE